MNLAKQGLWIYVVGPFRNTQWHMLRYVPIRLKYVTHLSFIWMLWPDIIQFGPIILDVVNGYGRNAVHWGWTHSYICSILSIGPMEDRL